MSNRAKLKLLMGVVSVGLPFVLTDTALAQAAGVDQVQNFLRSIIQVIAGLAALVATGFFVIGGFTYITSSGNPEHLDKAKRTLLYSSIGLAITISAFVLSNIVAELAHKAFGG